MQDAGCRMQDRLRDEKSLATTGTFFQTFHESACLTQVGAVVKNVIPA